MRLRQTDSAANAVAARRGQGDTPYWRVAYRLIELPLDEKHQMIIARKNHLIEQAFGGNK